jgi:hypothetical protein
MKDTVFRCAAFLRSCHGGALDSAKPADGRSGDSRQGNASSGADTVCIASATEKGTVK